MPFPIACIEGQFFVVELNNLFRAFSTNLNVRNVNGTTLFCLGYIVVNWRAYVIRQCLIIRYHNLEGQFQEQRENRKTT